MILHFTACPACGAVIEVTLDDKPVFGDGVALHREWHDKLSAAVAK